MVEIYIPARNTQFRRACPVNNGRRRRHDRHGILDRADRLEYLLAHLQEGECVTRQPLQYIDGADKFSDRDEALHQTGKTHRQDCQP